MQIILSITNSTNTFPYTKLSSPQKFKGMSYEEKNVPKLMSILHINVSMLLENGQFWLSSKC